MFIKVYNTYRRRVEYIAITQIIKIVVNKIHEAYDLVIFSHSDSKSGQDGFEFLLVQRFSAMEQADFSKQKSIPAVPAQFYTRVNDNSQVQVVCEQYANERFLNVIQ